MLSIEFNKWKWDYGSGPGKSLLGAPHEAGISQQVLQKKEAGSSGKLVKWQSVERAFAILLNRPSESGADLHLPNEIKKVLIS